MQNIGSSKFSILLGLFFFLTALAGDPIKPQRIELGRKPVAVTLSADGSVLATFDQTGVLTLVTTQGTPALLMPLKFIDDPSLAGLAKANAELHGFSVSNDGEVVVWINPRTGGLMGFRRSTGIHFRAETRAKNRISALALKEDGSQLAFIDERGEFGVWDLDTMVQLRNANRGKSDGEALPLDASQTLTYVPNSTEVIVAPYFELEQDPVAIAKALTGDGGPIPESKHVYRLGIAHDDEEFRFFNSKRLYTQVEYTSRSTQAVLRGQRVATLAGSMVDVFDALADKYVLSFTLSKPGSEEDPFIEGYSLSEDGTRIALIGSTEAVVFESTPQSRERAILIDTPEELPLAKGIGQIAVRFHKNNLIVARAGVAGFHRYELPPPNCNVLIADDPSGK